MTFIEQKESNVNPSWPKVGRHTGLLINQEIIYVQNARIKTKFTCCNENCTNYGAIYTDEPNCMASINSYDCAWCGWRLLAEKILPKLNGRLPYDYNKWNRIRVYQDEIIALNALNISLSNT